MPPRKSEQKREKMQQAAKKVHVKDRNTKSNAPKSFALSCPKFQQRIASARVRNQEHRKGAFWRSS